MSDWQLQETSTHQDHVVAHVIGATVLGYFVWDEALHVLLDIGFIWTIYVDGAMGLLPHPVAVNELEIAEEPLKEIKGDIDLLLRAPATTSGLKRFKASPVECLITDVRIFTSSDKRRLLIAGEEGDLEIQTSVSSAEILLGPAPG